MQEETVRTRIETLRRVSEIDAADCNVESAMASIIRGIEIVLEFSRKLS